MFETEIGHFYDLARSLDYDDDVIQESAIRVLELLKRGRKINDSFMKKILYGKLKDQQRKETTERKMLSALSERI